MWFRKSGWIEGQSFLFRNLWNHYMTDPEASCMTGSEWRNSKQQPSSYHLIITRDQLATLFSHFGSSYLPMISFLSLNCLPYFQRLPFVSFDIFIYQNVRNTSFMHTSEKELLGDHAWLKMGLWRSILFHSASVTENNKELRVASFACKVQISWPNDRWHKRLHWFWLIHPLAPHGGDVCSMQRDVESVHSGHYGRHMGVQCNVACAFIEIQIICNLFWALEAICHWDFCGSTVLLSDKKIWL